MLTRGKELLFSEIFVKNYCRKEISFLPYLINSKHTIIFMSAITVKLQDECLQSLLLFAKSGNAASCLHLSGFTILCLWTPWFCRFGVLLGI